MSEHVLGMYRRLLKLANSSSSVKAKAEFLIKIKDGFRSNRNESDPEKIEQLLSSAQSTLGYLKMVTPRTRKIGSPETTKISFGQSSQTSGRKATSNWTGSNMDPDSVKRHQHSLNRAGFRNNAHAKGLF